MSIEIPFPPTTPLIPQEYDWPSPDPVEYSSHEYCWPLLSQDSLPGDEFDVLFSTEELRLELELEIEVGG
jgi:hypothetical protein